MAILTEYNEVIMGFLLKPYLHIKLVLVIYLTNIDLRTYTCSKTQLYAKAQTNKTKFLTQRISRLIKEPKINTQNTI